MRNITLRVPNPEGSIGWYLRSFGGERTKLGGRLDAVKYGIELVEHAQCAAGQAARESR